MRTTTSILAILLLTTGLLTALPTATAQAPGQDGDDEEGLECADGSQADEIVDGLGTCDIDDDGQPDQVVGHIPLPGIGAVDVNANQVVVTSPHTGFVEFFSVTAQTEEDSPVGENTVRVSATCFMGNADLGQCQWMWIGSTGPFQPDRSTIESEESSILGEREATAGVGNVPVLATATCLCVWTTHMPFVDYEDEDRSLHVERANPLMQWYHVDYEEDDVGEAHVTGGHFSFIGVLITSAELEAETDEASPVGENSARVFTTCIGFAVNPCLASLSAVDASTGESSPAGENDVHIDTITCQTVQNPISGVVVSCRGGVLTQTNADVDSEHLGTQSASLEAFPGGPINVCTTGDHADEGCQTITVPPE